MKWLAALAFVLAILVRFVWHSSFALGFRINATEHRAYGANTILFWTLLLIGLALSVGAVARKVR